MAQTSLAEAFATILPMNDSAESVLRLKSNRRLVRRATKCNLLGQKSRGRRIHHEAIFDFDLLYGRRCLIIGSSRAANLKLIRAPGIDPYHCFLQIDGTGSLKLEDASSEGTWVRDISLPHTPFKLLRHEARVLVGEVEVCFGAGEKYHFRITPTPASCITRFRAMVDCHVLSVASLEHA